MKATLSFNLPEEREEHENAINGGRYRYLLQDLDNFLRAKLKYEELSPEQHQIYQDVRDALHSLLNEDELPL